MMTTAHYNRRLLKLADHLETIPRKRFNINRWVDFDWNGDQTLSCGTKACAMGHAATMPEFRRLGLRLLPGDVVLDDTYHGLSAAMNLFGLPYGDALIIFSPGFGLGENATPKQVARHIREFVAARS